jgi:hypothetical protein
VSKTSCRSRPSRRSSSRPCVRPQNVVAAITKSGEKRWALDARRAPSPAGSRAACRCAGAHASRSTRDLHNVLGITVPATFLARADEVIE